VNKQKRRIRDRVVLCIAALCSATTQRVNAAPAEWIKDPLAPQLSLTVDETSVRRMVTDTLGATTTIAGSPPRLYRFSPNGERDLQFESNAATALGEKLPYDMVTQATGQVVLSVGRRVDLQNGLVRLTSDGRFDPGFGSGTNPTPLELEARTLLRRDEAGRLLVAQKVDEGPEASNSWIGDLRRFSSAGLPDPMFGNGGVTRAYSGSSEPPVLLDPTGLLQLIDPPIVATWPDGSFMSRASFGSLQRFDSSGNPDTTWANQSTLPNNPQFVDVGSRTLFGAGYFQVALSDGSLLTIGTYTDAAGLNQSFPVRAIVASKYTPQGTLDETWGDRGFLTLFTRPPDVLEYGGVVGATRVGEWITVVGELNGPFLIKFSTSGTPDPSMGTLGLVRFPPSPFQRCRNALATDTLVTCFMIQDSVYGTPGVTRFERFVGPPPAANPVVVRAAAPAAGSSGTANPVRQSAPFVPTPQPPPGRRPASSSGI
jgi:hypothetical protein